MASLVTDDAEPNMDEDVVPIDTPCSADVLDVDFSPKNNTYAAALITGVVEIYQYTSGVQATRVAALQHHAQSTALTMAHSAVAEQEQCRWRFFASGLALC